MRVAPIGYFFQNVSEKLKNVARASGICTHGHRTAVAARIGAAYLIKLALDGVSPDAMFPDLLEFTHGISREFDRTILKVERCLAWEDEEKALKYLGKGWIGEELFALATFIGVSRPGYELNGQHIVAAFDQLPEEALHLVEVPALAISSTDCRARAARGRPIWYLVPDGVVQYVAKRGLYRDPGQLGRMAAVTLEEGPQ